MSQAPESTRRTSTKRSAIPWKTVAAFVGTTLFAIWAFPWLFHFYQVYDPVNSLLGLPPGLSGRLVFYDATLRGYRGLALPDLTEAPFFALPGSATDVAFGGDGRFVCYRQGLELFAKDRLLEREDRLLRAPKDAHCLSLSPDGNTLACLTYERGRHEIRLLPGPGPHPRPASWIDVAPHHARPSFGADGNTLYFATADGTVAARDLAEGTTLRLFPGRLPSADPSGRWLAFFRDEGKDRILTLFDLKEGREWPIRKAVPICPAIWSPEGSFLAWFEPIRGLWSEGPPVVRLRVFDLRSRSFSTLLQGRSFSLPERLTWIPKND